MPAALVTLTPLSFISFSVRAVDVSKILNYFELTPPRHSLNPSIGRQPLPHPFKTSPCRGRRCEHRALTGVSTRAHASVPKTSFASEQAITRAIQIIQHAGVIACVRSSSSHTALCAARAALDGGIDALEITMTTPEASDVIRSLVAEYPHKLIGAGTVLNASEAVAASRSGAQFLMSPATDAALLSLCSSHPLLIPGALTPSEVVAGVQGGARMVKIFPISAVGGVPYLGALKRAMPAVLFIAAGGVALDQLGAYLQSGASAVVLSDAIFTKEALGCHDFERVRALAREASEAASTRNHLLVHTP